jgi:hypothetical protein
MSETTESQTTESPTTDASEPCCLFASGLAGYGPAGSAGGRWSPSPRRRPGWPHTP